MLNDSQVHPRLRFSFPMVSAVTWRIVVEVLQRHHRTHKLSVLELHPGGGQCDCLALFDRTTNPAFPGEELCHINRHGSFHVLVSNPDAALCKRIENEAQGYVANYLSAEDPAEFMTALCRALRLPGSTDFSATTKSILMFRVIAELAARYALSQTTVDIRSGWYDSSGGPSEIRKELLEFPSQEIQEHLNPTQGEWIEHAKRACRYWLILADPKTKIPGSPLVAVLDLKGRIYWPDEPKNPWEVWAEYQARRETVKSITTQLEIAFDRLNGSQQSQ